MAGAPRGADRLRADRGPVADAVARLAAAAGWPVLAEPTSGVRCGPHDRSHVVAHYDVLLRAAAWAAARVPEMVLRVGDTPTSKPLRALARRRRAAGRDRPARGLARADARGRDDRPRRVGRDARDARVDAGARLPRAARPALAGRLAPRRRAGAGRARRRARAVRAARLHRAGRRRLPDGAPVWVSSSMPIRDVETFFPAGDTPLRFLANRGANGIDGMVSSALGAALANGDRGWLLTGDLALIYDLVRPGGRAAAGRRPDDRLRQQRRRRDLRLPAGGRARRPRRCSRRRSSRRAGCRCATVAALAGLPHVVADDADAVRAALGEPGLIEYRTDRAANVAAHRELFAAVAETARAPRASRRFLPRVASRLIRYRARLVEGRFGFRSTATPCRRCPGARP